MTTDWMRCAVKYSHQSIVFAHTFCAMKTKNLLSSLETSQDRVKKRRESKNHQ
ncbi:MAG: hypothetical protein Q7R66_05485 [Undibacterium sp.]|nr:hypothetical protein [Undibacterium sp.]